MVSETNSSKADQSAKPGNAMVHGWCMSVAISWGNTVELAYYSTLVSLLKPSHIAMEFYKVVSGSFFYKIMIKILDVYVQHTQ